MKLYIKNMVCNRCILAVENELKNLGFHPVHISLGEAELEQPLTDADKQKIRIRLQALGFEIINDKKSRLIDQIKTAIIKLVHQQSGDLKINLSDYVTDKLNRDYSYLSGLFSEVEGITIEKYFISQKIERVKELLVYDELTLSEIAFELNYSSVAHLSNQFKKITGLTPGHFKKIRDVKRKPLDEL
ncbi:MAG: helix-turn-helix transcriptional regulator [Bacteroidia bacterium]|nr:helix-turn-helix transcriptional regulator [Bacteroidia bacterium]